MPDRNQVTLESHEGANVLLMHGMTFTVSCYIFENNFGRITILKPMLAQ